jgi:hypothetical protein
VVIERRDEDADAVPEYKTPKEAEEICFNALLFGIVWGIGAQLEETSRPKFDQLVQEILSQENVILKYEIDIEQAEPKKFPVKLPEFKSLFELSY